MLTRVLIHLMHLMHLQALEQAGCFAIVLECVPAAVAAAVTAEIKIPTIGIGAGAGCSGQVHMLLNLFPLHTFPLERFPRDDTCGGGPVR